MYGRGIADAFLKTLKMISYILCSVDRASLYSLVTENNLVHNILSVGLKHVEVTNKTELC
jgi:hypothetical protein